MTATTCPEHDLLIGYALDDGISAAERAGVAAHLAACPACRREIASLRAALGLVASRVEDIPVPDLRERVLGQVAARDKVVFFPRRAWLPALAAAGLLFALAGYSLRPATTETPVTVAGAPAVTAPVAAATGDIDFTNAELDEIFDAEDLALWQEMDELSLAMDEAGSPEENDEV